MVDAGTELRDPATDDLVGRTLAGKWSVERRIGEGGMSVVYAARHRNGRRVALKVLRRELSANPRAVRRFVREGYLANKIEHPGAVAILDDDVSDAGDVFLVLELLEGETLSGRAARARAEGVEGGTLGETLGILVELLGVLEAAHRAGIVHRDVKPSNVFVTTNGAVKLLDFGIARLDDGDVGADGTRSGATLGTPGFMAPEQARGRTSEVDARTDVWAVGAVAFWLLTGRQVHEAETSNELVIAAATQPAPAVATFVDLPERVARVIDRALCLDRQERWADALAMRAAFEEVRRGLSLDEQQQRPARRFTRAGATTAPETPGTFGQGLFASSGDFPAAAGTRPSGGGSGRSERSGGLRLSLAAGTVVAAVALAGLLVLVRPATPPAESPASAVRPAGAVPVPLPSPTVGALPSRQGEVLQPASEHADGAAPPSAAPSPSVQPRQPAAGATRPKRATPARTAGEVERPAASAAPVDLLDIRQ